MAHSVQKPTQKLKNWGDTQNQKHREQSREDVSCLSTYVILIRIGASWPRGRAKRRPRSTSWGTRRRPRRMPRLRGVTGSGAVLVGPTRPPVRIARVRPRTARRGGAVGGRRAHTVPAPAGPRTTGGTGVAAARVGSRRPAVGVGRVVVWWQGRPRWRVLAAVTAVWRVAGVT